MNRKKKQNLLDDRNITYEPNLHFPNPETEKLYDLRKPRDEYNFQKID